MTDVFICNPKRFAIARFDGSLASIQPDDLLARVIQAVLAQTEGLDLTAIDEVILGCANQAGIDNRNIVRMSSLLAGLPCFVLGIIVNRLCASGMDVEGTAFKGHSCRRN